jgi:hypothetical protein
MRRAQLKEKRIIHNSDGLPRKFCRAEFVRLAGGNAAVSVSHRFGFRLQAAGRPERFAEGVGVFTPEIRQLRSGWIQ